MIFEGKNNAFNRCIAIIEKKGKEKAKEN